MQRLALALSFVVVVGCSVPGSSPTAADPSPSGHATPRPAPSPAASEKADQPRFPGYSSRLPRNPRRLSALVVEIYRRLPREVDAWLRSGGRPTRRATDEVHRGAVLQQRAFRLLVRKARLYRRVDRLLPRRIRRIVARHVDAQLQLSSLATPVKPPVRWKTYKPESPHDLKRYYKKGQERFRVPWQVLAAVNAVESRFGRILGPSSAGALGPMQFMPATWDIYGRGDIMDPRNSIIAAARYLSASGAPGDLRGALFAYNRSDAYVNAILTYAREIERDPRSYYAYYFWEVFVRTTKGDVRLTGPGR